jgi:hypothetical protein
MGLLTILDCGLGYFWDLMSSTLDYLFIYFAIFQKYRSGFAKLTHNPCIIWRLGPTAISNDGRGKTIFLKNHNFLYEL